MPPPAIEGEWDIRFGAGEAVNGWRDLCKQAPSNTRWAWERMRLNPSPRVFDPRHHRLKGTLATATVNKQEMPQWQLEVTGASRVWYVVDEEKRQVWVTLASTGHPKQTE